MMRTMSFLRLFALLFALALPALAEAQTAPPAAAPAAPAMAMPKLVLPTKPATPEPAPVTSPEAAKALADILKDDAARAVLIGELEKLAQPATADAAASSGDAANGADASDNKPAVPLAREIGSVTQDLSRQVVDVVLKIGRGLGNLARGFVEGSTTSPGDYVVERAFVEQ